MRTLTILLATGLLQLGCLYPALSQSSASLHRPVVKPTKEALLSELKLFKDQLKVSPQDAQLHLKLADLYKALGKSPEAIQEYAKTTELDANQYRAFHELSQLTNDPVLLDSAIEKLTKASQEKPKELMLRVALSELLEKRGNFHQAARTLIDITYANAVPEKYKNKVNSRIHFLLTQQKKTQQETVEETASNEEDLDVVPAPLPASTTKRSIASAKIKDAKEVKGMGNIPLLP